MTRANAGKAASHRKLNIALVVIIVAVVAAGAYAVSAFGQSVQAKSAVVHDADGKEYVLPLSKNAETVISSSAGSNTIVVENGTVRVSDADCPNHDCVNQGAISKAGQQIVCLPHKLTIDISDKDASAEYDVMGS